MTRMTPTPAAAAACHRDNKALAAHRPANVTPCQGGSGTTDATGAYVIASYVSYVSCVSCVSLRIVVTVRVRPRNQALGYQLVYCQLGQAVVTASALDELPPRQLRVLLVRGEQHVPHSRGRGLR